MRTNNASGSETRTTDVAYTRAYRDCRDVCAQPILDTGLLRERTKNTLILLSHFIGIYATLWF